MKYARLSCTINRLVEEPTLDAKQFLEMTRDAFLTDDLADKNRLCMAIGGANHVFSKLEMDKWLGVLSTATDKWFAQWPESPSSEIGIVADALFLGGVGKPADADIPYTVFRLFYLPRVVPDISSPTDIEEENLKIMLADNLKNRLIVFVTDWGKLNNIDCCVSDAIEMLGLGEQILLKDEKRVAVSLEIKDALYRPTWIDANFWVYWMPNLSASDDCGYARHLVTGDRGAKEWVCRANEVKINSAKVIRASRAVDYRRNKLPESYWEAARKWILDGRTMLSSNKV